MDNIAGALLLGIAVCSLYYIYDGYGRVLQTLLWARRTFARQRFQQSELELGSWPSVTVILAVFNEEEKIVKKIKNLREQDYPDELIEVIIVNDGSQDRTEELIKQNLGRGTRLINTPGREGKSLAQNRGVAEARGSIIVITDAAVEMERDCIKEMVRSFSDPQIGCVTARLLFRENLESDTGREQGMYWRYELKLRRLESELGLLATAAGPAMAIDKDCWRDLPAEFGDDCILPLVVALSGRRVVQAEKAIAWDEYFVSSKADFRARVRMTVRNWSGTFGHGELLNPMKHPGYAFALWSHKVLRWLSPLFVIVAFVGAVLMASGGASLVPLAIIVGATAIAGLSLLSRTARSRVPGASALGSFAVANAGFLVGLWRVYKGTRIRMYQN